jgi:hypothetical protein
VIGQPTARVIPVVKPVACGGNNGTKTEEWPTRFKLQKAPSSVPKKAHSTHLSWLWRDDEAAALVVRGVAAFFVVLPRAAPRFGAAPRAGAFALDLGGGLTDMTSESSESFSEAGVNWNMVVVGAPHQPRQLAH